MISHCPFVGDEAKNKSHWLEGNGKPQVSGGRWRGSHPGGGSRDYGARQGGVGSSGQVKRGGGPVIGTLFLGIAPGLGLGMWSLGIMLGLDLLGASVFVADGFPNWAGLAGAIRPRMGWANWDNRAQPIVSDGFPGWAGPTGFSAPRLHVMQLQFSPVKRFLHLHLQHAFLCQ
ncbi:hypothetical protein POM88_029249 [Heracleum sosnowskyi]|uniref:Uncharacterized protein n=1 Tax=Heracleum sosnowskyi TaxID=360622 RepID=A0AAD8HTN9_9APIA|nr:hypothetical protein POM88_029249 [Heracleum sosnowskyi]